MSTVTYLEPVAQARLDRAREDFPDGSYVRYLPTNGPQGTVCSIEWRREIWDAVAEVRWLWNDSDGSMPSGVCWVPTILLKQVPRV